MSRLDWVGVDFDSLRKEDGTLREEVYRQALEFVSDLAIKVTPTGVIIPHLKIIANSVVVRSDELRTEQMRACEENRRFVEEWSRIWLGTAYPITSTIDEHMVAFISFRSVAAVTEDGRPLAARVNLPNLTSYDL